MYQSPTIMEEVTQHHRNLAVASFDYKKPYNSPPWLDDKGVQKMDRNTKECDQAYQRVDDEMENEIGDLEWSWKDGKLMDTDIVWVPTRW